MYLFFLSQHLEREWLDHMVGECLIKKSKTTNLFSKVHVLFYVIEIY